MVTVVRVSVLCSQLKGQSSFGGGLGGDVDFLVAGNRNQSWLALAKKQFGGKEVVYRMEGKTERIRPQKQRYQGKCGGDLGSRR